MHVHVGIPIGPDIAGRRRKIAGNQIAGTQDKIRPLPIDGISGTLQGRGGITPLVGVNVSIKGYS
jgi:hypothetical protein